MTEESLRQDELGRAIRALPLARAPHTLAPRIMAAVRARLRARKTWFDWPVLGQVASVLGFMTLVALAALAWPSVEQAVTRVMSLDLVRLVSLVFRVVWQPLAFWFLALVTMVCLLAGTFGALLSRLVLGQVDVEGASR